jgi:hypothetical protein
LFKSLQPSISIGNVASGEFSLSFQWGDLDKHFEEVLN